MYVFVCRMCFVFRFALCVLYFVGDFDVVGFFGLCAIFVCVRVVCVFVCAYMQT